MNGKDTRSIGRADQVHRHLVCALARERDKRGSMTSRVLGPCRKSGALMEHQLEMLTSTRKRPSISTDKEVESISDASCRFEEIPED